MNQSTDLQSKSMDWFLYDKRLRHEQFKQSGTFQPDHLQVLERSVSCYNFVKVSSASF